MKPSDYLEAAAFALAARPGADNAGPCSDDVWKSLCEARAKMQLSGEIAEVGVGAARDPAAMAFRLAVYAAIGRRVSRACLHTYLDDGVRVDVLLGAGISGCPDCLHAWLLVTPPQDDGRCDVCDEPTTIFVPFTMNLGDTIIHGDLCEQCYEQNGTATVPIDEPTESL